MTFDSPATANRAAIALRAQGNIQGAIGAFRNALEQFPSNVALHQNLAQTLYEAGDTDGAIREHRNALHHDQHSVASHLALYELLQITGERALALAHQRLALEDQRLFSHTAANEARSVLLLCAPGDWQTNIPLDFILDPLTTTVHKLYLLDAAHLRLDALPRYDVLWNTIAEAPETLLYLDLASRIMATQKKPSLNAPARVFATGRPQLGKTLAGTNAHVPALHERARELLVTGDVGFEFPVIARPIGSHAGTGLRKLDAREMCEHYVNENPAGAYYVSPFVDYSSADGYFRKYRIQFVDGVPFPVHLAISKDWMIHYYNAPMSENEWMRNEEAAFLADLSSAFAPDAHATLLAIAKAVGLEYFGIDCSIDREGKVLVFEADPAMLVHASDPISLFPYKHKYIPRIFSAVEAMLDRRKIADRTT